MVREGKNIKVSGIGDLYHKSNRSCLTWGEYLYGIHAPGRGTGCESVRAL